MAGEYPQHASQATVFVSCLQAMRFAMQTFNANFAKRIAIAQSFWSSQQMKGRAGTVEPKSAN